MLQTEIQKPPFISHLLAKNEWQAQKEHHEDTVSEIVEPYLKQKRHQKKNVVLDFLFEYYAFRPSHLKKWSPGFGIILEKTKFSCFDEMTYSDEGAFLNPDYFPAHRKQSARWILNLLEQSLHKKPSFGCFGMHEWAMVYKAEKLRHSQLPLRMPADEIAAFVESRPPACTHFDAFRFFTEPAQPLNKFELSREHFASAEQPGCLHTNMDLYKWGFKMFPWISSNAILRAFLLALKTRTIDMKASPYDLRRYDLQPIKIETKTGRREYVTRQKEIYRQSIPVRKRLIEEYRWLIQHIA